VFELKSSGDLIR